MSDAHRLDVARTSFGSWELFFGLVTIGTILLVLANPSDSTTSTAIAAVLVAAVEIVYFVMARPRLAGVREDGPRAWTFAILALVVFTVAATLNPWSALLLFALTPQIFLLLTPRPATVVIVAINLLPLGARLITQPFTLREAVQEVGSTAFIITFSLFFASRVLSISRQNEERRRLIEQLHEREAEVAALSAARGAEAERTRISREMHDTLAQGFASIVTLGHAVLVELDRDPEGARRHVELITDTARENLAESRRIMAALGPGRLDGASLSEAIGRSVDSWRQATGIDAALDISGPQVSTEPATDVVALRLVQEGLENVRKHAGAGQVTIGLRYAADEVEVEVRDDGVGFDAATKTTGYGLPGMRSRVGEAGGTIEVSTAPGAGTLIKARLPVERTS